MKKYLLPFFAILGLSSGAYSVELTKIEPTAAVQAEKAQGIWIDVRSAEEFEQGHLQGALNVPHTEIAKRIAEISPNKDEPIHLYCRSGRRAQEALQVLQKLGYQNVTNHGGYEDLRKQGLK